MSDFDYQKKIEIEEVGKEELFHAVFPTDAFEFTKPGDASPTLTLKSDWSLIVRGSYVTPPGGIMLYGAAAAPAGWLLCNGAAVSRTTYAALFAVISTIFGVGDGSTTFNVPDFQGIFPRGAGTSTKLTNANSVAFAGTLGTYQNDKIHGHTHLFGTAYHGATDNIITDAGSAGSPFTGLALGPAAAGSVTIGVPYTDATNGTPRTGTETNPANLGITFIIKY